jgi:putative hydrolase of the HAD superfamily
MVIPVRGKQTNVPTLAGNIEAIFFDMNGTLRRREPHEPTRQAAYKRILELLGKEDEPDEFWEGLARRTQAYNQWAQGNLLQLSEKEIWTRWLLPGFSSDRVERVADELMLAWKATRGRTVPQAGAEAAIIALRNRGYRLGVISNSMSSLDIPHSLDAFGWKDHFKVVILSAMEKYRKPAPEIFRAAARAMNVMPAQCAHLGNRASKDVVGCKRAGFGLGIIIEPPGTLPPDHQDQTFAPDAVIHSLSELLDLFPWRVPLDNEV